MSWRDWVRITPREVMALLRGGDVQVTETSIRDVGLGRFPELHVHAPGQDVPVQGIVVDPASTSEDLEHLAEEAEVWARRLREAARIVRDREDSEPEPEEDEGEEDQDIRMRQGVAR